MRKSSKHDHLIRRVIQRCLLPPTSWDISNINLFKSNCEKARLIMCVQKSFQWWFICVLRLRLTEELNNDERIVWEWNAATVTETLFLQHFCCKHFSWSIEFTGTENCWTINHFLFKWCVTIAKNLFKHDYCFLFEKCSKLNFHEPLKTNNLLRMIIDIIAMLFAFIKIIYPKMANRRNKLSIRIQIT